MKIEKIGKFIAKKRKEKKLTQLELANKLYITDRAVSKWERGKGMPDVMLMEKLCKILDITIPELLNGEEIESKKIDEKELVDSLKIMEQGTRSNILKPVNQILLAIFIVISSVLIFNNFKNIYFLSRTSIKQSSSFETTVYNLEQNIKILNNNQGKFSEDEYTIIQEFLKKFEDSNRIRIYNEINQKEKFNVEDILYFQELNSPSFIFFNLNNDLIEIILKHDLSLYEHLKMSDRWMMLGSQFSEHIYTYYNDIYNYSFKGNIDIASMLSGSLYFEALSYETITKYLIEAGDINE